MMSSAAKTRTVNLAALLGVFVCIFAGACQGVPLSAQTTHGSAEVVVRVPFVGCSADGQVGPLTAPRGQSKAVAVPAKDAERLAYYKGEEGFGVLAPRGWHCFETYGSNGSNLYVSPQPLGSKIVFSDNWKGFAGPAIQLSVSIGDTSGRFEVAKIIARVFPAHSDFVQNVIAEGIEPASDFPAGPYPTDRLTYRSKEIVEFQTPASAEGLGTRSRLQKGDLPICGVAILAGEEMSLVQLSIRLPSETSNLAPSIIHQTEIEAVDSKD